MQKILIILLLLNLFVAQNELKREENDDCSKYFMRRLYYSQTECICQS